MITNFSSYCLPIQRLRYASNPSETWGPALQRFRDDAAEVHELHGTTMGGKVQLPSKKKPAGLRPTNGAAVPEKRVKYNPNRGDGNNGGVQNPGFDSPMA